MIFFNDDVKCTNNFYQQNYMTVRFLVLYIYISFQLAIPIYISKSGNLDCIMFGSGGMCLHSLLFFGGVQWIRRRVGYWKFAGLIFARKEP